jgi:hypothetical protein
VPCVLTVGVSSEPDTAGELGLTTIAAVTEAGPPSPVVECRVKLGNPNDPIGLEMRISDAKLIQRAVLDPLAAAKADPKPAEYKLLGQVTILRKDGSEEGFVLFSPWRRVSSKGKYLIVDFTELRKACRTAVEFHLQNLK